MTSVPFDKIVIKLTTGKGYWDKKDLRFYKLGYKMPSFPAFRIEGKIYGERRIGVHGDQKKGRRQEKGRRFQEIQEKEVTRFYLSPDHGRGLPSY